jgi:hypothetical protein
MASRIRQQEMWARSSHSLRYLVHEAMMRQKVVVVGSHVLGEWRGKGIILGEGGPRLRLLIMVFLRSKRRMDHSSRMQVLCLGEWLWRVVEQRLRLGWVTVVGVRM